MSCENPVSVDKARIGLHGMAAGIARPQFLAAVEFSEAWQEVLLDVGEFEVRVVELVVALVAKPHEAVLRACLFACVR